MGRLRFFAVGLLASAALIAGCTTGGGGGGGGGTNTPPHAVATANPTSGVAPLTVAFRGSDSTDSSGSIATYAWNFGDGSADSSTANPSHEYTATGDYTASLLVIDNGGATDTAFVTISVGSPPNSPPVAVAHATPTSGKAPLTVGFSSAGSGDPDGSIMTYEWDFGDMTGTSNDPNPTHIYATAGPKVATLTVTDNDGAVNTDSVTITANANQAPTAMASGLPTSGKAPLTVVFSTTGSGDTDGTISSYSWAFSDGGTASGSAPSHTFMTAGAQTATLTVTDDNGATDTKTVNISVVANHPPTAVANATPSAGQTPLTVHFDSSLSGDSDGSILTRSWDFGDGNTSNQPNPIYTYSAVGIHTATLTVTDDNGAVDTDTVDVNVTPIPNVPPSAAASATPSAGKQGFTAVFSSAGSGDTDGTILSYDWDFGDGGTSAVANPSHTYPNPGDFLASLTVTDNAGGSDTAVVSIHVDPNVAPTANASASPLTGKQNLLVTFSSSLSNDSDGTILSRHWDFGDGGSADTAGATHTYTSAGTKVATLTVTDDNGATDTDTVIITVTPNSPPVAAANATPQSGARPLVVHFDGTSSSDPDGGALTYDWDFGDGPAHGTGATPTHTYAAGTYTATLTVTDDAGATSTSSVGISAVVDDDGDGVSPPTDCNDTNGSIKPGAPDALDSSATDSNCDGVDGQLSDTVFVSATGSGATCTLAAPCQTIQAGITALSAKHVVQVASGTSYAGFSLVGASDVTIRGGFTSNFTSRNNSAGQTVVNGNVLLSGSTFVSLDYLTINGASGGSATGVLAQTASRATLNFDVVNSGTPSGAGASAYGLRAIDSSIVAINNSLITAAAGIPGTSGTTPSGALTAGTNGANGVTPNAVHVIPTGATTGGTGINAGGNGGNGDGSNGVAGTNGGGGGTGGCSNCTSNSNYSSKGGLGGTAGANGTAGSAGTAGGPAYAALWTPSVATGGATGGNGGGGGGGGGGGRACDATACAGSWIGGGSGARGGGGGQGAPGGTAGSSGGGSFAVYSYNSTITIDANTTLTAANGGTGGSGAAGQAGAAGGSGGTGGSGRIADCCTGNPGGGGTAGAPATNGAKGGDATAGTCCNAASGGGGGGGGGGNGGIGGTGGGGAGGPSVGMLAKGTGGITFAGNQATQVTIGTGGSGGAAPGGNPGTTGTASKLLVTP